MKWHDSTTGYLQLLLAGQFPSYMKVQLLPQVKTGGCLLALLELKLIALAELVFTLKHASPLPMMMSAKRVV